MKGQMLFSNYLNVLHEKQLVFHFFKSEFRLGFERPNEPINIISINKYVFWRRVWSMDMEFKFWLMALNMKVIGKMIKQTVKTLFIDHLAESIRESGKAWKQHGFPLLPCKFLNRDFCMIQMDCKIRQMKNLQRVAFLPEYRKNCLSNCMKRWIKSRHKRIPSQVQIWEGTFYFYFKF